MCLGVAPQPSPLPWKSAGISSVQGRGTEADWLPQPFLSLLNPNAQRETGESGNGTDLSFSPRRMYLRCLLKSSSTQAGSDPYQVSQGTWAPGTQALVKAPGLQEPAIGTSHELLPVCFLNKRTLSPFASLPSRSESGSRAT